MRTIQKLQALLFSLIVAIVLGCTVGLAPLAVFGGLSLFGVIKNFCA